MSASTLSSASSTASAKFDTISRRQPSLGSLPALSAASDGSETSSETDSDDASDHTDEIIGTGNTSAPVLLPELPRGMTTLSLALHDIVQTPLDPLSMWIENTENSRIEKLFCNLSKDSTTLPANERWRTDQFNNEFDSDSNGESDGEPDMELNNQSGSALDRVLDMTASVSGEANTEPSMQ